MRKPFVLMIALLLLGAVSLVTAYGSEKDGLSAVRAATAQLHRSEVAQAAGWDLVPGLDHCFENPGVGAMGYHYINTDLLDSQLDPEQPEALVYTSRPDGRLKLAAVEYIVPAAAWNGPELPELHGQAFHLNSALGVYVLHAWIWKHNPAGIFEDWNPEVSCP